MNVATCLNTATIRPASLIEKIEAAADAGFDGVGLWHDEINAYLREGHSLAELLEILVEKKLVVHETCYIANWQYVPRSTRKKTLDEARWKFEQCAELGAGCMIAVAGRGEHELSRATDEFVELCETAAEFEVKVALEFIFSREQIKDLATAWEIVEKAEQENGGLVLDTHHFFLGGSDPSDILSVSPSKIFIVHISDAPKDVPVEEMTYKNRVHIGTGIIPLREILEALAKIGYSNPISVEIFNEDYWRQPPEKVVAEAKKKLDELLREWN